jgi:DEAD/DEAH box helicase domain-containing protein
VVGFKKIKFYTNENVGSGELDLPEQQMHTSSYWLTIPSSVMAALPFSGDDRRDGVVGLAFAMRNIAQLLLMCDRHDIGLSVDGGTLERSLRTGACGPSEARPASAKATAVRRSFSEGGSRRARASGGGAPRALRRRGQ